MGKILITEATGNLGSEVIRFLNDKKTQHIIAGVRNVRKAMDTLADYKDLEYRQFDIEDKETYPQAFENIDLLFLIGPPHLSDVEKVFRPMLQAAKVAGIRKIVFLSVRGAENIRTFPQSKIEKDIRKLGFEYIFEHPTYLMQNLTTTFVNDIRSKMKIILPAGKAKFNWIDTRDIGEVTAQLILDFEHHKNQIIEITGGENHTFETAAKLISDATGLRIKYKSLDPFRFFNLKRNEGLSTPKVLMMTIQHFLPRFKRTPKVSPYFEQITGHKPTTLKEFIEREGEEFRPSKLRALIKVEQKP